MLGFFLSLFNFTKKYDIAGQTNKDTLLTSTWPFFVFHISINKCFIFDNKKQNLNVYLNTKKVLQKVIKKQLDNSEIKKNFFRRKLLGNAYQFARKYSDLNS